jgi:hypothetical protein
MTENLQNDRRNKNLISKTFLLQSFVSGGLICKISTLKALYLSDRLEEKSKNFTEKSGIHQRFD